MASLRRSEERGNANHGWLKSRHTFSFANYHDPKHMGFRSLRVINEDRIQGGTGFGSHPHRDMEIISYVVEGALEHRDSMGTKAVIRPGDVQRMTAGSGVVHSEYNADSVKPAHFFQIWIMPRAAGGTPGYGQKSFESELAMRKLVLVISPDAREGSIGIMQDADMHIARLEAGDKVDFKLRTNRGAWVQVISGSLKVNTEEIRAGDALSFENGESLDFTSQTACEFILFDLA